MTRVPIMILPAGVIASGKGGRREGRERERGGGTHPLTASGAGIPAVQSGIQPGIKCTKRDPKRDPNGRKQRGRGGLPLLTGWAWGREDGWVAVKDSLLLPFV